MPVNNRVIFLDFDGVLHPCPPDRIFEPILPLAELIRIDNMFRWVPLLAEILDGHKDVRIIVHSTWRLLASDEELRSVLGPLADRFAGSTPRAGRRQSGF